jgi:hypothetical protein
MQLLRWLTTEPLDQMTLDNTNVLQDQIRDLADEVKVLQREIRGMNQGGARE